jgi:hypothetical protein
MLTHACISLSALCTCVWQKEDGSQDEETAEVNRLHKGDYFGELALLTEQPRAATVTAVGDVECICLDTKGVPRTRTHPRAHETERERWSGREVDAHVGPCARAMTDAHAVASLPLCVCVAGRVGRSVYSSVGPVRGDPQAQRRHIQAVLERPPRGRQRSRGSSGAR